MTSPQDDDRFDWQAAEADLTNAPDAEVVDLDTVRSRRQAPTAPVDGDGSHLDDDTDQDAESIEDGPARLGGPVDMADDIPGEVLARQVQRRPILAEWARSRRALRAAIRHQSKDLGYVTAYHGVRLPKYLAKTLVWAPIGAIRGIGQAVRWARAYVEFAAGEKRAWLRHYGIQFFPVVQWAERGGYLAGQHGNSVPRFHLVWGTGPGLLTPFVRRVMEHVRAGRVELRFRHRVTELVTDGRRVAGARGEILSPSTAQRGKPSNRNVDDDFEISAGAVA